MHKRMIVLVLSLPLAALPSFCGCGSADESITVTPEENPCQIRSKESKGIPGVADGSRESEKILARLRDRFPKKTDDEIVQSLRGYVSDDRSAPESGMRWLAERLQQAKKQREAVETITKKLYGKVRYDYQLDAWGNDLQDTLPPGPTWLKGLVGENFVARLAVVWLWDSMGTDAAMAHIEALPHLQELHLNGTQVTDSGLRHFKGLGGLRRLYLGFTGVSDAGLLHLQGLPHLEHLELVSTKVTDAGLEHLKGLRKLQWLGLDRTLVTGTGAKHLEVLANLEVLDLSGTPVTDIELENLKGLKQLHRLCLHDTNITDEGLKKLRQALPTCDIIWFPPTEDEPRNSAEADQPDN